MGKGQFCEKLSGESCTILDERCLRLDYPDKRCAMFSYYRDLTDVSNDTPPIAREVRENILEPFLSNWKSYAKRKEPGRKDMTASPLEKELRTVLRLHLTPLGVSVPETGRRLSVWENCKINADGLATKEDFPKSIFSFKTWVGTEQIRETFAYAYLAKTWLGQKGIRVYEIGLQKLDTKTRTLDSLVEICKPYLDGVFYLTTVPYLDDLIEELKQLYSGGEL